MITHEERYFRIQKKFYQIDFKLEDPKLELLTISKRKENLF